MKDTAPDLSTRIVHHPYQPPGGFEAPQPGIFKASTVIFPNVAALRSQEWKDKSGYTYGLHGTPTTFTLEERLCALEGGLHCVLVPSGLAAIGNVALALLKTGDEVLVPDNAYGPNKAMGSATLAQFGVRQVLYDALNPADLAAKITPATRLVWLEAPGSVTLEFPDLRTLVREARAHAPQAVVALDNTWGAGIAFNAFDLGEGQAVDVTVHALTKYPSGGADVLMGSVACRDDALHQRLAWCHSRLGLGVGANDVEALLRGLPSLALRYAAQDVAGRHIAAWCAGRAEFVRVLHPALPDSPGHAHWAGLCSAAAGLVTVEFDPRTSAAQVDAFVDALRLFRIGWSWGGPVSLAVPYQPKAMRALATPYRGTLVRLCIGLEAVEDLVGDLAQALAGMADLPT